MVFDKGITVELDDNGNPREDNYPKAVSSFVRPNGMLTLFDITGGVIAQYPSGRWVRNYTPGHSSSRPGRNNSED